MRIPLTKQDFLDKVIKIHNNKYDYSKTNYINCRTKITIICPKHGEFEQLPNNHWQGAGCPKCKNELTSKICKYTTDKFINLACDVHGKRYDYSLTDYKEANKKVTIICSLHGSFQQTPANHLQGQRCPKCAIDDKIKLQTLSTDEFIKRSKIIHNNKYNYDDTKYIHSKIKIKIKCPIHGEFEQTPNNHLKGAGCPGCNSSRGEELIAKILTKQNIQFIRQYKIPNIDYKFRYDFYLPVHNLFIEFHGIQHFEPIGYFGGQDAFNKTKIRDSFKKDLAKMFNIKIIYITYKDLNRLSDQEFEDRLTKKIGIRG